MITRRLLFIAPIILAALIGGADSTVAAGATSRVSVNSAATPANADTHATVISGNGQFVAFHSPAYNIVNGDNQRRQ